MCKIFYSRSLQIKCAGNAVSCDTVAVSLPCTDPRYLFVHPISLMTLMATFIIIGWAAPGGLSIQMVLFLPVCLSGHRRTAARGHMFYYRGQF